MDALPPKKRPRKADHFDLISRLFVEELSSASEPSQQSASSENGSAIVITSDGEDNDDLPTNAAAMLKFVVEETRKECAEKYANEIAEKDSLIAEQAAKIAEQSTMLAEQTASIASLKHANEDLVNDVRHLKRVNGGHKSFMSKQAAKLAEQTALLAKRDAELAQLQQENDSLTHECKVHYYNSYSLSQDIKYLESKLGHKRD